MIQDDPAFEPIDFTDIVRHTLVDMYELGIHSFESVQGPYFWNSIGIDFEVPMPTAQIRAHAASVGASKLYLAHTHPLSTGDSLTFLRATTDPREEIACNLRPLPLGNLPSSADVLFLHTLKKELADTKMAIVGVVFSASGIWEFDVSDPTTFHAKQFEKAYEQTYPVDTSGDFMEEWSARMEFPSYSMELYKPKMHESTYQLQHSDAKEQPLAAPNYKEAIQKATSLFKDNGASLVYHPYTSFGIDPQALMRETMRQWKETFKGS